MIMREFMKLFGYQWNGVGEGGVGAGGYKCWFGACAITRSRDYIWLANMRCVALGRNECNGQRYR